MTQNIFRNLTLLLVLQLVVTVFILIAPTNNIIKTVLLLILWMLTFGPLTSREIGLFVMACLFFSGMNVVALKHGIFFFRHPDIGAMPLWEFFMYGFYLLHTLRMIKGPCPPADPVKVWFLVILMAAAFGCIADQHVLILVTFALLGLGLWWFHEPFDLMYTGYFIFLGALIEYSGVYSGQWAYPGHPPGGVPLWFITMWGGIGLLLRRLVVPIVFSPAK